MQMFRINRVPLFQAPDLTAAGGDPPPVDPAVVANSDPASPPPAPDPAPAAGDPPAPAPVDPPVAAADEPKPHGNKGQTPWYMKELQTLREDRRVLNDQLTDTRAVLDRLQRGGNADPAPQPVSPAQDQVEARAREIVDGNTVKGVVSAGVNAFNDWDQKMEMLGAVGAASAAFALSVHAVDPANAHKILYALADDPQKAAHLAKMDPVARTVELVKMSMAAGGNTSPAPKAPEPKPAPPKTVSKAPAPAPAIEPSAAAAVDWRDDKVSDKDFSAGWEAKQRERMARRR